MLVSIILPVRNEAATIREVLSAVLQQDYPRELIEVVVADGMSEDGTREIVRELAGQDARLRMVDNPKQFTPVGLNLAIRAARGEVIVRVDGHGVLPLNYVRECVAWLDEAQSARREAQRAERGAQGAEGGGPRAVKLRKAQDLEATPHPSPLPGRGGEGMSIPSPGRRPLTSDLRPPASGLLAVGGAWDSVGRGCVGEAIAIAMSSKFGVGNSPYRTFDASEEPFQTDTVPFWAIKRGTFERVGLFREEMLCHEDYEFNHRLRSAGGVVLLLPWLRAKYYVRSTLGAVARQYWRYGIWKGRFLRSHPRSLKARHLIPPLFVALLAVGAIAACVSGSGRIGLAGLAGAYLCFLLIATMTLILNRSPKSERQNPKSEIEHPPSGTHPPISVPRLPALAAPKRSDGGSAPRPPSFALFALLPVVLATLHFCWGAGVWVGLMRGKVAGEPPRLKA